MSDCPDCGSRLKGAGLRCACGWRAAAAIEVKQRIDIDAHRQAVIDRANAEIPEEIKRMTPAECRARLFSLGGFARMVPLREPGADEEEDHADNE